SASLVATTVLLALLPGAESYAFRNDEAIIKPRECSREGTLRTFRFSDARNTPLFCECLPGFDGRYCEQRICRHGAVRIVDFEEIDSPGNSTPEIIATTACVCDPGFRGPSCEERMERKPAPWTTVVAFLEPIFFFIVLMIPCCCAFQMIREFVVPLFNRAERYSMIHYDPEQGLPPKTEPHCTGRCCEVSAPPAYSHIYSNPMPTVTPAVDLRQPIYSTAKIFPHV
ncbi:hypothetical protein PMAYCL1PPCAC_19368, partial [Pristionchus mayeri]